MDVKIDQKHKAERLSELVFKKIIDNLTSEFKDDFENQIVYEMI